MVSTFTPNIQLEEPARGDQVGVWDTPVNNNMTLTDLVVGGTVTIGLNNSNVVLSAAQFQAKTIVFNSTLTGNVTITFPTSFKKSYEIVHACTGSSQFIITLQTSAAPAANVICAAPGQTIVARNDGATLSYVNFGGPIGTYWDYAATAVPAWITNCSIPPYINCDGTSFSSGSYPALTAILNGTTLPDMRGRFRYTLNQGTGRTTTGGAGVDGNTLFATGGSNGVSLVASQIPAGVPASGTNGIAVASTTFILNNPFGNLGSATAGGTQVTAADSGSGGRLTQLSMTGSNSIGVATTNAGQTTVPTATPTMVSGITMIRAG